MMKNYSFKRKIELKTLLDDASSDHIESFIEKNKNSSISDDMLRNIKAKTFEKTGIKTTTENETLNKKSKKPHLRRWFYAAACLLLAFAVVIAAKHINFGNNPPVVSGDDSNEVSVGTESEHSVDNSTESQPPSQDDPFEIKGINWADERDESGRVQHYNAVKNILDNEKTEKSHSVWATVVLESITKVGSLPREQSPDLHLSVAEIKILEVHYCEEAIYGEVVENQTMKIVLPYIVEDEKIIMSYGSYEYQTEKLTDIFPMAEVGKKYVVAFYELGHKSTLELIENNFPELAEVNLHLLSSYPMFNMDFSNEKNLGEFNFRLAWVQMYVATYDRYIKDKALPDSPETSFYNCFKEAVYSAFGPTPEKPKEKGV